MSDAPTPTFRLRTDAIYTVVLAAILGFLAGVTVATLVILANLPDTTPDPYNGVPACTDEIADAGGICHGEPVSSAPVSHVIEEPASSLPAGIPVPTVQVPSVEYVTEYVTEYVEVEVPVEVPVEVIETVEVPVLDTDARDAAYLEGWFAGAQARDTELTELWGTAVTTPCATEDSSTCYWDALTMGNGEGDSFVDVEGALYYR